MRSREAASRRIRKETRRKVCGRDNGSRGGIPGLKNAELQKTYGVIGEVTPQNMLYTNEYDRLIDEVQTLSGLENFDDLKDEAKNA